VLITCSVIRNCEASTENDLHRLQWNFLHRQFCVVIVSLRVELLYFCSCTVVANSLSVFRARLRCFFVTVTACTATTVDFQGGTQSVYFRNVLTMTLSIKYLLATATTVQFPFHAVICFALFGR